MGVDIHKLIAAISPEAYCKSSARAEVKELTKKGDYLKAAEKAKPKDAEYMDFDRIDLKQAFTLPGYKNPIERHTLSYDAMSQGLESMYFWLVDYINKEYVTSEKLVDTFAAATGSGHFAEISGRATRMQEESMKIFGTVNTIIKSVLNIIYDMKEFKMKLDIYKKFHSDNKEEKDAALLALKQNWMEKVDINHGNSSILMLARQFDYVTLIDSFMVADSMKKVSELDLNERVKRILSQRMQEFLLWVRESEKELKKRYEIEKIYLKSQVNSIKLYARWLKPYLQAAKKLEQQANPTAALVTNFNTAVFELDLMGIGKYEVPEEVGKELIPRFFLNLDLKKQLRKYKPIIIVELRFRSVPERSDQRGGYTFRGRFDATFTSYALSLEELDVLRRELEKSDFGDLYKAIEGATDDSLAQIQVDLDDLLGDEKDKKKEKKKDSDDTNPFSALFSFLKFSGLGKKEKNVEFTPESEYEKVLRSGAIIEARRKCSKAFGIFKGTYQIPSF